MAQAREGACQHVQEATGSDGKPVRSVVGIGDVKTANGKSGYDSTPHPTDVVQQERNMNECWVRGDLRHKREQGRRVYSPREKTGRE
jgi:hypothetical protein